MSAGGPNPTLAEATGGHIHESLPFGVGSPLVLDKPTRDRLVIADPSSAPLIRRALAVDDLHPWHADPAHFLIAIPRGWTANAVGIAPDEHATFEQLAARHPALAKYLRPHEATLRDQPHGAYWWELPPYPVDWFSVPSIVWSSSLPHRVAPMLSGAYLLEGVTFTTAPTSFLLGVLGGRYAREAAKQAGGLHANVAASLVVPIATSEQEAHIGTLAEQLVEQAQARAALEREVGGRILRDLAPMGATLGPRLERWWELSFIAFLDELERRFKSDVPFRYREGWQRMLNEQRRAHFSLDAAISQLEAELDDMVERLLEADS